MSQGVTDPDRVLEILGGSAVEKQDASKFGAGILNAESATSSVYLKHTLYRVGFLGLFLFVLLTALKKNNKTFVTGTTNTVALVSAAASSVGILFFLPLVGALPYMGSFRWLGELLSRPIGEWDLVWHTSLHNWLPLASALPAFVMAAFGFHRPVLRAVAGGLAIGTAAYLSQIAWSGESQFVFGTLMMRVWAMVNVVACLWVAKNTLAK
jgi:hypothetical protein